MKTQSIGQLDLTFSTIEQLVKLATEHDAAEVSAGNNHQHFHMKFKNRRKKKVKPQPVFDQEDEAKLPTEDELLYWSTSYDPDIKAEKPE